MSRRSTLIITVPGLMFCVGWVFTSLAQEKQQPYVATIQFSIYAREPGKPEVLQETATRIEARDRDGRRYTSANSNEAIGRLDRVRDVVSRRLYWLDREKRIAYNVPLETGNDGNPSGESGEFNGVPCTKLTLNAMKDGMAHPIGVACLSTELGMLQVHEDVVHTIGGKSFHVVTDLARIRMGEEPPPEWLNVPADFKMIAGAPVSHQRPKEP